MRVADCAVGSRSGVLSTIGLGSCVAISLYDATAGVGGLAHILLPSEALARDRSNRAKFPGTAVPLLLERMRSLGARDARVRAKIAGGASMFASLVQAGTLHMGERNILATREALERSGIPLVAQDVGGAHGRSIFFHLADGRVEVRSLSRGDVVL